MMGGIPGPPMGPAKMEAENKLTISWVDSSWIPHLSAENVMAYFSDRRNPFYDVTCNNEVLKMQNRSLDQLANLQGIEYCLLYVQEPILYVIRKQNRNSPSHVTPISDYYIVAGTIYQAPDLCSVVNSRLLSAVNHLQAAFDETKGYSRYHPTKGYWWDFQPTSNNTPYGAKKITLPDEANSKNDANKKKKKKKSDAELGKEEPSSVFQRVRVDYLLKILTDKFPAPQVKRNANPNVVATPATSAGANAGGETKSNMGDNDIKSEKGAESIKSEKIDENQQTRGIKREAGTSSARPGSAMDKKMKFS